MPVVRIRILIGTTVVRIRILIGTTVVRIRILIGMTVVRIASVDNNKKCRFLKSKEYIHKKEVGPYRCFGYSSLISDPLNLARENIICTIGECRETFYGHHTAQHSTAVIVDDNKKFRSFKS